MIKPAMEMLRQCYSKLNYIQTRFFVQKWPILAVTVSAEILIF